MFLRNDKRSLSIISVQCLSKTHIRMLILPLLWHLLEPCPTATEINQMSVWILHMLQKSYHSWKKRTSNLTSGHGGFLTEFSFLHSNYVSLACLKSQSIVLFKINEKETLNEIALFHLSCLLWHADTHLLSFYFFSMALPPGVHPRAIFHTAVAGILRNHNWYHGKLIWSWASK